MADWEYGEHYKRYDMTGTIETTYGLLQVHDITHGIPDHLLRADAIISDPPCSQGNIKAFYTKAGKDTRPEFEDFTAAFWSLVDRVNPYWVALELFAANRDSYIAELLARYSRVSVIKCKYYNKADNVCWFALGSNDYVISAWEDLAGMDEAKVIEYLCINAKYNCVCDPCMGQGLVGYHAARAHKRFVGTELNEKRLACLLDKLDKAGLLRR